MARYRLLDGQHTEGKGPNRVTYDKGAVFDSEHNLEKFNRGGNIKFQRIPEGSNPILEESVQPGESLDSMTLAQLKSIAADMGLEVPSKIGKKELVTLIEQSGD